MRRPAGVQRLHSSKVCATCLMHDKHAESPHQCASRLSLPCRGRYVLLQGSALPTYLDGICKGHDVDVVRLLSHGLHKATTEGLHAQQIITHALQGSVDSSGCPWLQPGLLQQLCSSTSATALADPIASGQAAWPAKPSSQPATPAQSGRDQPHACRRAHQKHRPNTHSVEPGPLGTHETPIMNNSSWLTINTKWPCP